MRKREVERMSRPEVIEVLKQYTHYKILRNILLQWDTDALKALLIHYAGH